MKNLNKITKYFIVLFWVGLSCSILKADDPFCGDGVCNGDESYDTCPDDCNIVITEIFIKQADGTHTPQYVELYNNSPLPIDLENWSIKTLDDVFDTVPYYPVFNSSGYVENKADMNTVIEAFGYFLISSASCPYSTPGCDFYYLPSEEDPSDIIASYLILPFNDPYWIELSIITGDNPYIDKGSIVLTNDNNVEVDRIDYDITAGWPIGEESRGRSLRLHSPELDNSLLVNWSLSPKTEKSIWLYDEGEEIKSFGSPREENSFRLKGAEDFIHIISGDVNNIYNADNNYEYNNYANPIDFSWYGTFDTLSGQQYKLIIEKTGTKKPQKHGFEIESFADITLIWESIIGTDTSIIPQSLLIDQLEVADYSWTLELTKGSDIIYSDRHHFSVDASDYGYYGCIDESSCKIGSSGYPTCPTTADDETLFSNHPIECIPGVDCYSAINFDEYANINSNTCHYVSLSIPAFVVGDTSDIVTVPVYLYNDSSANINSIAYTLSFDNSSEIISYYENASTFAGTISSGFDHLGNENIIYDATSHISVNMEDIAIDGGGIITYLGFKLIGSQSETINLTFSDTLIIVGNPENNIQVPVKSAFIIGGNPENNIQVPVKEGEIVILQTDYVIDGQVYYYSSPDGGESVEVPNVELKLNKNYDGVSPEINYFATTAASGFGSYFRFESLIEGNYNLSFSKSSENDYCNNGISGYDLHYIFNHLTGNIPLNEDQFIAADVSLDSTVSGYDVSLIAQYLVDLIPEINDIKTHWIFKPEDQLNVHSELLEHNGIYSIEYKPLVLDDTIRTILAYRLGDVTGNYCSNPLSRSNRGQVQFTDIAIDYTPIITLPIIISEPTFIEGMDIEIGYDEDVFNPLSITFNNSNEIVENYQTVSNLLSKDRTIKTVTWAIEEAQIVEGKIGEVSFNWNNNNKSGKIWLKEFQVNDEPAIGGISLIGLSDNDVVDGVNIINSLVPVQLSLHQNYPNPFNPQTTIKWSMPLSGIVSLEVYNLQGQLVELLFNGQLEAGIHEQIWDATAYPSGIYFYRMTTNKKTLQKVMLLLK